VCRSSGGENDAILTIDGQEHQAGAARLARTRPRVGVVVRSPDQFDVLRASSAGRGRRRACYAAAFDLAIIDEITVLSRFQRAHGRDGAGKSILPTRST
jgi:hypothetical protein